jgi:hypothetical protein
MRQTLLSGKINAQTTPQQSILDAFDRAVEAALERGDHEALARLERLASENANAAR